MKRGSCFLNRFSLEYVLVVLGIDVDSGDGGTGGNLKVFKPWWCPARRRGWEMLSRLNRTWEGKMSEVVLSWYL